MVAVHDSFGKIVTPDQLMKKYKLNEVAIVAAMKAVMKRKKQSLSICEKAPIAAEAAGALPLVRKPCFRCLKPIIGAGNW